MDVVSKNHKMFYHRTALSLDIVLVTCLIHLHVYINTGLYDNNAALHHLVLLSLVSDAH